MREQLAEFLPNVYRFARHLTQDPHLAEDLAQEAMVRAIHASESTTPDRPLVWLLRVVENLWRDRCRQKQRRPPHESISASADELAERNSPAEIASSKEEIRLVLNAMERLPERQRTVMHLMACEQLSIFEIAEVLNITQEAVRSSLSLARKQLRQTLSPNDLNSTKLR